MTNYPYKTREGGATVTVFVPYDCGNHCPFCINKQEYENPVGFSLEKICESIRTMDEITPKCDFVFTGGEPFADLDALQTMLDQIPTTHRVFINTTLPTLQGATEDDLVAFTEKNKDKITCIIAPDMWSSTLPNAAMTFSAGSLFPSVSTACCIRIIPRKT